MGRHTLILFVFLLSLPNAYAKDCFDFSKGPIEKRIFEIPKKDGDSFGARGDISWGALTQTVPNSSANTLLWLLDHTNWKDMSRTEVEVKKVERKGFHEFHEMKVELKVMPLWWIEWGEFWGYQKDKAPNSWWAFYQKAKGTDFLDHLCGQVSLQSLGPNKTRVSFFEEADSPHWSGEDIVNMHKKHMKSVETFNLPEKKSLPQKN